MKLESQKFALLISAATGAVYAVCSVFVFLFPEFSATLAGSLTHLGSSVDSRGVTLGGFVLGLAQVLVYAYILGLVFAWVFNKSSKNS